MFKYIARRILLLLPVLIGVTFIVFSLLYLTPGDPARMVLGDQATEEALQEFRNKEGLNDPFLVQYGRYVWKALHGDIGRSYMTRRPVSNEILSAFPSTIRLAALSMIIAVLLGIPFGIIVAIVTRMTRSSMLEVVRQDYIRTVRAKGQKESVVIWRHALGNALIPVVTIVGLQFGHLLGGAVLTESIFSIPGVGRLMVEAIKMRDYPLVQGGVLYIALAFSLVNLLVDLLYAWIDPRIKAQYK